MVTLLELKGTWLTHNFSSTFYMAATWMTLLLAKIVFVCLNEPESITLICNSSCIWWNSWSLRSRHLHHAELASNTEKQLVTLQNRTWRPSTLFSLIEMPAVCKGEQNSKPNCTKSRSLLVLHAKIHRLSGRCLVSTNFASLAFYCWKLKVILASLEDCLTNIQKMFASVIGGHITLFVTRIVVSFNNASKRRVGLAIISYPINPSGIIVLLKTPTKFRWISPTLFCYYKLEKTVRDFRFSHVTITDPNRPRSTVEVKKKANKILSVLQRLPLPQAFSRLSGDWGTREHARQAERDKRARERRRRAQIKQLAWPIGLGLSHWES